MPNKPLQPVSIVSPGFFGLNTQEAGVGMNPAFALLTTNSIVDKSGRIAARKGWSYRTSSGGTSTAPRMLFEFDNFEMQVSLHRLDHRKLLQDEVSKIIRCRHPWTVRSFDEADHKQLSWQHDSIKIYFSIFKDFVVPYQAQGQKILPWRSDPADAHKICGAPNTPVLHRGKLYKCPAVANAIELAKENWFNYHPVEDPTGLQDFVNNIGKPETVCGQCPNQAQAVIIDHFDSRNVDVR